MAITRAQQARQMYKKGSKPVEQAGVMNYMPSEMVTVPKIAKSSPDTPTAKLAYITPEEQDILIDLNLYGSLDGKPNRGPGGIPSLEGDFGPDGKGNYSEEGTGRGVGPGSKDKDTSAFTDKGTGKYEVSTRPEDRQAVIDYSQGKLGFQKGKKPGFFTRPGSFKQKQQIYNIQQRLNAINRYTNAAAQYKRAPESSAGGYSMGCFAQAASSDYDGPMNQIAEQVPFSLATRGPSAMRQRSIPYCVSKGGNPATIILTGSS